VIYFSRMMIKLTLDYPNWLFLIDFALTALLVLMMVGLFVFNNGFNNKKDPRKG
jgi:hypothetical protein